MQDDRRALGAAGETRAAELLARRGYRIVDRNVRVGGVEVALIVRRGGLIAFVEVKTRRSTAFGRPEQAVDGAKQARLVRAAAAWLAEHPGGIRRLRFDVVTCSAPTGSTGAWECVHWPAAFDADG